MEQTAAFPRTGGNENTNLLKWIALLFMILDHTGAVFFSRIPLFRLMGRIAFPLYAWCLAVGSEYTRDMGKYALRLFLGGLVSQPFFMMALKARWDDLNIFFTLLLGVLGIYGIREKRMGSHIWAPVLSVCAAFFVQVDYGWKGVLFILLLYAARKNKGAIAAVMTAFCLFWGATSTVNTLFFVPSSLSRLYPQFASFLNIINKMQFFAIFALPFILIPLPGRLPLPKWLSYAFYPGHLLILYLIRTYCWLA